MFGTIRRHQTWLWVIISTLTVISFVIFGPTNQKLGDALSKRSNLGTINGRPITVSDYSAAEHEVYIGYFFRNNYQWPDKDASAAKANFNIKRETLLRLMLIEKQRELGVQISTEAIAEVARQQHVLGELSLDQFEERVLKPEKLNAGDFERFLRHELGMQQLVSVAGLSGKLVTPQEAETLYRNEHQDLSTAMAFFPASNYTAKVTFTPEGLADFYNKRAAFYRIPDQRRVDYVKYDVTNYLAQAKAEAGTNLEAIVNANYMVKGSTNFYHDAKTPEEAKAKVAEDYLHELAMIQARKAAGALADELDRTEPKRAAGLEELAKTKGLTVKTTAPFDAKEGPDLNVLPSFTHAAFSLTTNEPFSGAIRAEDGVYVLALKETIPSTIPPLKDIQAKVEEDYRLAAAAQMARQAGANFEGMVTNGLAQGKTFKAIADEAKVKAEELPPFSLSTSSLPAEIDERVNFNSLKNLAFMTPVGKASPFIPTEDGGFVLYVKSQSPVNEAKLKDEMPKYLEYLRQVRQNEAFNQWFGKQVQQDAPFYQVLQESMEGSKTSAAQGKKS
ncbi:MAG: hypothetical protein JWR19_3264 [Pedosphaera sp.]|nr:hypothetical protein [Pedosphaera sp.]